ncbi:MAG: alpha/beta hydrolase [Candidatus Heimdallarchaeota archaeon]|nr:alpha/beta hydrolase [Candidatus Heimdallarchaeota archaeon]
MIIEDVKIPYYQSYLGGRFFIPSNGKTRYPVVCKVHGLISNSFAAEEKLATLLTRRNIGYFVFHFTGYHGSPGETSIHSELLNLDSVITFLTNHPRVDPLNIGLYAVSLGAAVAICHTARDSRIMALALQTPLFDFSFMVNYPEFSNLWQGLALAGEIVLPKEGVKEKLLEDIQGNNPLEDIKLIAPREILIIAGGKDTFIPFAGIQKLFQKAKEPKKLVVIPAADHNINDKKALDEVNNLLLDFFLKQFQNTSNKMFSNYKNKIEA